MRNRYSITSARAQFSAIVARAEAGEEIELTRRGKPVTILISHRQLESLQKDRVRFSDVYGEFLRKHSLERLGIDSDFFQTVRGKPMDRSSLRRRV